MAIHFGFAGPILAKIQHQVFTKIGNCTFSTIWNSETSLSDLTWPNLATGAFLLDLMEDYYSRITLNHEIIPRMSSNPSG